MLTKYISLMFQSIVDGFTQASETDILRVIVSLAVLSYASYADIKTRRVTDKIWGVMYSVAVIILVYEAYTSGEYVTTITEVGISIALVGGASYVLYRLNIFYGADYKAMVGVAVMFPVFPELGAIPINDFSYFTSASELLSSTSSITKFLLELNMYVGTVLFGFAMFTNTAVLSVVFFLSNTFHNLKNGDFDIKHPLRSACARKIRKEDVTTSYAKIIEEIDEENPVKRGWLFITRGLKGLSTQFYSDYMSWYRSKNRNNPEATLSDISEIDLEKFMEENEHWVSENIEEDKNTAEYILDKEEVWATPSIPFIVPITLGVLFGLAFGNVAFVLLQIIVG